VMYVAPRVATHHHLTKRGGVALKYGEITVSLELCRPDAAVNVKYTKTRHVRSAAAKRQFERSREVSCAW
jgi:hypothetical protein